LQLAFEELQDYGPEKKRGSAIEDTQDNWSKTLESDAEKDPRRWGVLITSGDAPSTAEESTRGCVSKLMGKLYWK
jgi:hypothetical protein